MTQFRLSPFPLLADMPWRSSVRSTQEGAGEQRNLPGALVFGPLEWGTSRSVPGYPSARLFRENDTFVVHGVYTGMKVQVAVSMAAFLCAPTAPARLVACSCGVVNTVCLTDVQMSEHALHVEMEPDRMGNHSNYRGVAVFQIGFDEEGHVTGASAISGHPLGISHLMATVSKWRFKPIIMKGVKKKACGKLSIKFAMIENVPTAEVLRQPVRRKGEKRGRKGDSLN
jgi:hypothetical protein